VNVRPLRVLAVDDSAVVRQAMIGVLGSAGIDVATAADPLIARRKIAAARPDVILLDLEMPREDGLSFLRELMARDPIPVVICSCHSTRGSQVALEALDEGAVDVVAKPRLGVREFVQESATLLADAVRAAASARLRVPSRGALPSPRMAPRAAAPPEDGAPARTLIAIAASTGGPQALLEVLGALPADAPGLVVVQHMPGGFTTAFADHLDARCRIRVREAADGDVVRDGLALIAPGGLHVEVARRRGQFVVEVSSGPLVSHHRPSADVLFRSVARMVGADAVGVILTGMGNDGAAGLRAMREAGATTLAQDEASCVVFGMPREAVRNGAVDRTLPLSALAPAMLGSARARRSGSETAALPAAAPAAASSG